MPVWMKNRIEVTRFLRKLFPRLKTDARQKEQFEKWRFIIERYLPGKISSVQIADLWGCRPEAVTRLIQRIRLAAANKRQSDGKPRAMKVAPDPPVQDRIAIPISDLDEFEDSSTWE